MPTQVQRNHDTKVLNDLDAVAASSEIDIDLEARGAEVLVGEVQLPNNQYDVTVKYMDPSYSTVLAEETIASNTAGGTATDMTDGGSEDGVQVLSPWVRVTIKNDGTSSDSPEGILYLR